MCGIAGVYNMPEVQARFPEVLGKIAHRGPDAGSIETFVGAGYTCSLGHRRLSIIDLSTAANQPMTKDGHTIVFNGEIYNYENLRGELVREGATFQTRSDTEVLLEAWRRWGTASLARLRGMFAFCILEHASGKIVLARDQFGIKPLYYSVEGRKLAFASELKALAPIVRKELDPQGLVASFIYGWVPDDYGVWKGINKLPAGHVLVFDSAGHLELTQYYDLAKVAEQARGRSMSATTLRAILEDSVKAHMIADVPVATFLSGGLDSSLITVLARRLADRLESFTITFRPEDQKLEAMPDDLRYARRIAAENDVRLHEIEVAPDLVEMLPRMVSILDEPISDAGAINTVLICHAARQMGLKVLLSGIGADEIFAGYRKHQAALLAARYRQIPNFMRRAVVEPLVSALPVAMLGRGIRTIRFAKRFLSFASLPEEEGFMRSYSYLGQAESTNILREDLLDYADKVFSDHQNVYHQADKLDAVNRMCFTDIRLFLQSLNLTYSDRASMAESTEVRVPFVDTSVVDAAFSVPGSEKISGGERKAVLKAAAVGILPNEVIYRPKAAFSAPLRAWTVRELRDMIGDQVIGGQLARSGWLSRSWIEQMVAANLSGAADYSHEIWQLLTTELWLQSNDVRLS